MQTVLLLLGDSKVTADLHTFDRAAEACFLAPPSVPPAASGRALAERAEELRNWDEMANGKRHSRSKLLHVLEYAPDLTRFDLFYCLLLHCTGDHFLIALLEGILRAHTRATSRFFCFGIRFLRPEMSRPTLW
jgi:hypothetical protein